MVSFNVLYFMGFYHDAQPSVWGLSSEVLNYIFDVFCHTLSKVPSKLGIV